MEHTVEKKVLTSSMAFRQYFVLPPDSITAHMLFRRNKYRPNLQGRGRSFFICVSYKPNLLHMFYAANQILLKEKQRTLKVKVI